LAFASEAHLVLVASLKSQLPFIPASDVRRLFLGVPLMHAEKEVVPLLNGSVVKTKEPFLQKVLFMSAPVYERPMVGRVLRNGGPRILEFQDGNALVQALTSNPKAISFMSGQEAQKAASLKVLGNL
jgi:hypothetical protein